MNDRPSSTACKSCGHPKAYHRGPGTLITEPQPEPWKCAYPVHGDGSPCDCCGFVEPSTLTQTTPDVGSLWIHKGGRICKVTGNRITLGDDGKHIKLVEFKYRRSVWSMGRNRSTPTQTMPLETWRGLFIREAPP